MQAKFTCEKTPTGLVIPQTRQCQKASTAKEKVPDTVTHCPDPLVGLTNAFPHLLGVLLADCPQLSAALAIVLPRVTPASVSS